MARWTMPGAVPRAAGALALGAALLTGHAGPAAAAAAVTLIQSCPYAITAPGAYALARDLTCPGADAITVTADNVRLVLGRHRLTGDGSHYGIYAHGTDANPTLEGLRIAGGTVAAFSRGVRVEAASGAGIAAVTAVGNHYGMALEHCAGCWVFGSRLDSGTFGVILVESPGAQFTLNAVTRSEDTGIDVARGTNGAVIENNRVSGSGDTGIDVANDTADNVVRGNRVSGSGKIGIAVEFSTTDEVVQGNRVSGSGRFDMGDGNLPATCPNTWRGNSFKTDNEGDGPGRGCIR